MIILSIETSCDETAVSIIKTNKNLNKASVLADNILSQIDIHKEYGGVFPMIAKREHAKCIVSLIEKSLKDSKLYRERKIKKNVEEKKDIISKKTLNKITKILDREKDVLENLLLLLPKIELPKIDAIAVTSGPGLSPALWVGINTALALGEILQIPVYPVNHMEGHIIGGVIKKEKDYFSFPNYKMPAAALLISGGHTEIVLIKENNKYKIIGETRDDAIGEAFDKVARMLELSYPGGPKIGLLAQEARDLGIKIPLEEKLPRPMIYTKDLDFSFSGLKTAVLYKIKKLDKLDDEIKRKIALDFENSVTEILIRKIEKTREKYQIKSLIVGGGVSASRYIRKELHRNFDGLLNIYLPEKDLSTDNSLMIALTCMLNIKAGKKPKKKILADGSLVLK